ncbi:MAG: hypothetical protein ABI356_03280 [Steroidobacteraceae bacterium]
MAPIPLGAIAGLILSSTTSFLITGHLFHPYQKKTPSTWRAESWRQHMFASLLQAIAGAGLGWLFALAGAPPVGIRLLELGAAVWMVLAASILIQALYVNWDPGFVVGLVIDWTVFIAGVLLVCAWLSAGA